MQLKLVEAVATGLPMTALAALVGPLRLSWPARRQMLTEVLPWAVQNASPKLISFMYEEHWEDDLDTVRDLVGIRPRQ